MPRALVIGAGAVGQVYARHLQKAGVEVCFFVKPKYAEEARAGYTVYPLGESREGKPFRFDGFGVVTSVEEVAAASWDQVWLCVSSPALRGDWLPPMLEATRDATVVALTPGMDDLAYLGERTRAERIVAGMIAFVAWQSPLPGETRDPPGIAYFFPPLQPSPFSGTDARVVPIVAALRAGGCPAKKVADASAQGAVGSSILLPLVAGLEAAGWSFAAFGRSPWLHTATAAAREALVIVAGKRGGSPAFVRHLVRPWTARLVLWAAPKLVPVNFEVYMKYHFTKVGDQTRQVLGNLRGHAEALSLPHAAIDELASALG